MGRKKETCLNCRVLRKHTLFYCDLRYKLENKEWKNKAGINILTPIPLEDCPTVNNYELYSEAEADFQEIKELSLLKLYQEKEIAIKHVAVAEKLLKKFELNTTKQNKRVYKLRLISAINRLKLIEREIKKRELYKEEKLK